MAVKLLLNSFVYLLLLVCCSLLVENLFFTFLAVEPCENSYKQQKTSLFTLSCLWYMKM